MPENARYAYALYRLIHQLQVHDVNHFVSTGVTPICLLNWKWFQNRLHDKSMLCNINQFISVTSIRRNNNDKSKSSKKVKSIYQQTHQYHQWYVLESRSYSRRQEGSLNNNNSNKCQNLVSKTELTSLRLRSTDGLSHSSLIIQNRFIKITFWVQWGKKNQQ